VIGIVSLQRGELFVWLTPEIIWSDSISYSNRPSFTLFFYSPTLNLANGPIFLHWKNISFFFQSIQFIFLTFSFLLFFFIIFFRLVAGSKFFFFLLIFYRVQIRIMNICHLPKKKKNKKEREAHNLHSRCKTDGSGPRNQLNCWVNSSQKVSSCK